MITAIQEATDVESKALSIPEQAKTIIVTNNETLLNANEVLLAIKDIRKEIDATFDPIIKKAHEAHKEAVAQKKKVDAPLVEAEQYIKPQIASYVAEQERIRRAEEMRLREEARRAEEERLLAEAAEAEAEGNHEEAQKIIEEPVIVPTPVVARAVPKMAGVSVREVWKHEVVDFMALVKAVAAGQAPVQALQANDTFLGQQARSLKKAMRIPGVVAFAENSVAAGRR